MSYLCEQQAFYLAIYLGELNYAYYLHHPTFLRILARASLGGGHHRQAWNIYQDVLHDTDWNDPELDSDRRHAESCIPHLQGTFDSYPQPILKQLTRPLLPLITLTITS
jgi:hypothetical protein